MQFKMDIIEDILSNKIKIEKKVITDPLTLYKKFSTLFNEPLLPETIYIGMGNELIINDGKNDVGFILIGTPKQIPGNTIILSLENDILQVYNYLVGKLQELQELELNLTKSIYNGTYQDMLETAYNYLQNPMVLIDISCRSLGIYPPKELPGDVEWNYVVENGFFSLESTKNMKDYGNFDLMNTFDTPGFFTTTLFPNRAVIANIRFQDINIARIIMPEVFHSYSQVDLFATKLLADALQLKMANDQVFKYIRGNDPVYIMFYQLLSGISLDKSLVEDRVQNLPAWDRGYFRILSVPLGENSDQIFYFFANSLQKLGYTILFENNSVTFIHYLNAKDFDTIKILLEKFIIEADLTGYISNEFTSLSDSYSYFKQAKVLYSFINKSKTLYCYHDFVLMHLFSFYDNEDKVLLSHPALKILKEYDSQNNTAFYVTLRSYLQNERSLIKTAKDLYIHRNTLLYRIDKIQSLLNLDLEHKDIRLHLLMSYQLME